MKAPLFEIETIRKQFGTRTLLDVGGVVLRAGVSYVLTGDNGAGKTTLLRIIGGLEAAQVARARYRGLPVDLTAYPAWMRREVIYVHPHPYLFRASVKDNIGYGLKVRGAPRHQRQHLIHEAVRWARVEHLLNVPAHRLSAGEKQRVALARARVLQPRLFLLDEPTANLDAESRRQTVALIRDLCDEEGTALIACHDQQILQLPSVCQLRLQDAHIVQCASPISGPASPSESAASEVPRNGSPEACARQPVAND
jgi:tungstate transport system ATP-binding protein